MPQIDEIKQARINKLEAIQAAGWNPYPSTYDKKHTISEALASENSSVTTAGRILSLRTHGNISFADLKDETGKIQLFFKKETLGDEAYKQLKLLDIGDFIGVTGQVGRTAAGEISIIPESYTLLSKAMLPLPNEWFGLKDVEARYRQRYLDLIMNDEVRERFDIRSKILRYIREYLDNQGFWEAETPVLQPLYGGANAKPFMTYYNALDTEMYLSIASELYLKRLIAGGYEKVYDIGHDFRNEGIDRTHSPEFTMLESYEAYADYHKVMDMVEGLLKYVAEKIFGTTMIKVDENTIDIGKKWPRIRMVDILKERLNLDVNSMTSEELIEYCNKNKIKRLGSETKGQLIFLIFDEKISGTLSGPIFIIDYPADVSPLSKSHHDNPEWVQRFEGYIGGKEICDGWSEINDPAVQRDRFTSDTKAVHKDDEEAQVVDEDFLTAMEHGMPPFGGLGLGIDRLTMFFSNTWAIREVTWFPTLRPEKSSKPKTLMGEGIELFRAGSNQSFFPTMTGRQDKLMIDEEVKSKWPSMIVGYAIIKGVKISKENSELETLKKQVMEEHEGITTQDIESFKELASYRRVYEETGVDLKSRKPSPEALLRRIAQKQGLYTVNTCVDAYNLVVLKNRVSVGAFDLDKMTLPAGLLIAKEEMEIELIGGEVKQIKAGELCYVDAQGPYNLDLNYRDADRTKITENTQNIFINVEGVYDISRMQVERTLQETIMIIEQFCGGELTDVGIVV